MPSAVQRGRHHHYESDLHSDYKRTPVDRGGGYNSRTTLSTPPPASVVKDHVFEKRPRRKTRQDRYDTVKSKDAIPTKKQAKRSSTRVSKSGRLRSSREVMANFKSSAITNPTERITLKSTFVPGLFVNGRSSAPVADLVFNEIPLPDEDGEPSERKPSSDSTSKGTKEERARREDIQYLTNALKRLREDYPAPDHLESRSISILSGGDFPSVQRSSTIDAIGDETAAKEAGPMARYGLDGSAAPDKAGDGDTLRSLPAGYEMQSHSVRSRAAANEAQFFVSNTLKRSTPSDGDPRLEDHKTAPGGQSELEPSLSRGELKSCGSQTLNLPNYQDKGVMVSPRMYQATEIHKPNEPGNGSQPLFPDEASVPIVGAEQHRSHVVPETPRVGAGQRVMTADYRIPEMDIPGTNSYMYGYPTYLPGLSAGLDFGAVVKDPPSHPSDPSPAWFFGRPSSQFPLLTVDSFPNSVSTLVDDTRHTADSGMPCQPTRSRQVFPIAQDPHGDFDFLCTNALQDDEDMPGESLTEYIERMEREILGSDETLSIGTDDGLLSMQPTGHNQIPGALHPVGAQCPDGSLRRLESEGPLTSRGSAQRPVREDLGWTSQSLPRPESFDGLNDGKDTELAFFWRPNHMMWC